MLTTASLWLDFFFFFKSPRANSHYLCIASIFMASLVSQSFGDLLVSVFMWWWLIPVSPLLFLSFQKPWMIWGPVVAVALTAVTAAALLRTWGQQAQTHTNTANQDSRSRRHKKKIFYFLTHSDRKFALVGGSKTWKNNLTDETRIISRKPLSNSTRAKLQAILYNWCPFSRILKCILQWVEFLNLDLIDLGVCRQMSLHFPLIISALLIRRA